MEALKPTFVTCTWGAGGSTFEKTTELSAVAQTVHGLETCMHLTCTNMDRGKVDEALAVKKMKNDSLNFVDDPKSWSNRRLSFYRHAIFRKPRRLAFRTSWPFEATHPADRSTGRRSTTRLFTLLTLSAISASNTVTTFVSELQVRKPSARFPDPMGRQEREERSMANYEKRWCLGNRLFFPKKKIMEYRLAFS